MKRAEIAQLVLDFDMECMGRRKVRSPAGARGLDKTNKLIVFIQMRWGVGSSAGTAQPSLHE